MDVFAIVGLGSIPGQGTKMSMGSLRVGRDLATEEKFMCVRLTVSAGDLFHLNTED